MGTMKQAAKKLMFNICPTYRHTTYLLSMQQETKSLQQDVRDLQQKILQSQQDIRTQLDEYLNPQSGRFTDHYEYWRAKRITAIVEYYGEAWFKGKKVLELGCGYGDIGYVLMTLGAEVIFAEGREENCNYLRRRFPITRSIV